MLESMARSIRRNWSSDYNRHGVARAAMFLRFEVDGNDPDLIVGTVSDEVHSSLHQLSDQIIEYLILGIVWPRHPERNFDSLRSGRVRSQQTDAQT
jgi:hypothetical protein